MSSPLAFKQFFETFKGLDKRSSFLTRNINAATEAFNTQFVLKRSNSLAKRKGYKAVSSVTEVYGCRTYAYLHKISGEAIEETCLISDTLLKRDTTGTLTINYSGTGTFAISNMIYNATEDQYVFSVEDSTNGTQTSLLGTGKEASPKTLATLKTEIDAFVDYTATLSSAALDNIPAAMLVLTESLNVSPSNTIEVTLLTEALQPLVSATGAAKAKPFISFITTAMDKENASMAIGADVLYIGTGTSELYKYDGQTLYRAGIPQGSVPTVTPTTGTLVGTYQYITTYEQQDFQLNIIEGEASILADPLGQVVLATNAGRVSTRSILDSSEYNTGVAVCSASTVGTPSLIIPCTHGSLFYPTFHVGDRVYFYDSVEADYVTRVVTAITVGTSFTVDGAAVGVGTSAVISAGLNINIWRTTNIVENPGSEYYLVATIPNNSSALTTVYDDDLSDADLLKKAFYIVPDNAPGIPPKGSLVAVHQGALIVGGILDSPNSMRYSDINLENFPALNNLEIFSGSAGSIRGFGSTSNYLAVFKDSSIALVRGDLSIGQISVDFISENGTGTQSPDSIVAYNDNLLFYSRDGFYQLSSQGQTIFIGNPIAPFFVARETFLSPRRAQAVVDPFLQTYLCYVTAETGTGAERSVTLNRRVFAFAFGPEIEGQAWFEWDRLNWAGGVDILTDGSLVWADRDGSSRTQKSYVCLRHETQTGQGSMDETLPIRFLYASQWDISNSPSGLMKILRLAFYSVHPEIASQFTLDVNIEKNFTPGLNHTTKTIEFGILSGGGGYGADPYGSDPYGTPRTEKVTMKAKSNRMHSARIRMENNIALQNVVLTGYEYEIPSPYEGGFKK